MFLEVVCNVYGEVNQSLSKTKGLQFSFLYVGVAHFLHVKVSEDFAIGVRGRYKFQWTKEVVII